MSHPSSEFESRVSSYQIASQAKSSIISIVSAARVLLPAVACRQLFIHLNLMHVSAYCALTPVYTYRNFMTTFCKLHHIEYPEHEKFFEDVDTAGGTHYNTCCTWAQGVIHEAMMEGHCHHQVFHNIQAEITQLRSHFNALFAYQFQVIPFSYSHLVSAACFFYLLGLCVLKALRFRPEAAVIGGLVLPALSFMIALMVTFGLIEIGQCIADPWGNDPEDFAVPRFLHSTAKMTRYLVECVPTDPLREQGTTQIGSPDLSAIPNDGQSRVRVHENYRFKDRSRRIRPLDTKPVHRRTSCGELESSGAACEMGDVERPQRRRLSLPQLSCNRLGDSQHAKRRASFAAAAQVKGLAGYEC